MKKVLIYYRYFGKTLGGGEFLPLIFIAELQSQCEVTLALYWTDNFENAVDFFGIPVDISKVKLVKVMPKNFHDSNNNRWLSFYRFLKLRKLAKTADICISMANVMDFGKPAYHFMISLDIGDPDFYDFLINRNGPGKCSPHFSLKQAFNTILRHLLGMRTKREIFCNPKERIFPNSNFMNNLLVDFYGTSTTTVFYPPTIVEFPPVHVKRDPLKVVYLGRVAPSKRIDDIISVVKLARERSGENLTLDIAGHAKPDYIEELNDKFRGCDWIKFIGIVHGREKTDFLLSGSFAVHAMRSETFGISITEYLKAGLIPVVPDEGGANEVTANPELSFHDLDEAAGILVKLLKDPEFRNRQSLYCAKRAKQFSKQHYLDNQHRILSEILNGAVLKNDQ
ncbi:MAG: glycosyltransferase [Lentisphaeria bacterium]|nr:glycosyltransferase [Lentisphaeria bacterium]